MHHLDMSPRFTNETAREMTLHYRAGRPTAILLLIRFAHLPTIQDVSLLPASDLIQSLTPESLSCAFTAGALPSKPSIA